MLMQGNTNFSNCKRLSPAVVQKKLSLCCAVNVVSSRKDQSGNNSTERSESDSARILAVDLKSERRMQSLMSCVPREFVSAITSDEEVVLMFLKELWPHIVGKELARNSEPVGLSNRVLRVRVPSALWANQLAGLRKMVISSINQFWQVRVVETIRWEFNP